MPNYTCCTFLFTNLLILTEQKKTNDEDPSSILTEPIDPEILERMPPWFKKLREAYQRSNGRSRLTSNADKQQIWIDEAEFVQVVKILIKHLR